jgi:hypothetical protein
VQLLERVAQELAFVAAHRQMPEKTSGSAFL